MTSPTIQGDLNVISTGTGSIIYANASSGTININGNYNLQGGDVYFNNSGSGVTNINLAGNYNQTGGTHQRGTGTGIQTFNFTNAASNKNYIQSGGSINSTGITFNVNLNAIVTLNDNIVSNQAFNNLGTLFMQDKTISGTGSFNHNNAITATLGIGDPDGITTTGGVVGNVQVTGTKTYGITANYIYNGVAPQVTGNALTTCNNLTIDNTTGVTQQNATNTTQNVVVTNLLSLNNGAYQIGGLSGNLNALTLNGLAIAGTPTNLASSTFSNLIFGGAQPGINIPSSIVNLNALTCGNTNTQGVSLNSNLDLHQSTAGVLTLNANSRLFLGTNNLTIASNAYTATPSGTFSATSMVVADGTGQLRKNFGTSGFAAFTFPIGDNSGGAGNNPGFDYAPMAITFTANSLDRIIGVNVTDAEHPSNAGVSDYASRFWSVTDSEVGNGTYSYLPLSLTYSTVATSDVNGSTATYKVNRWNGANWSQYNTSVSAPTVTSTALCNQSTGTLGGNEFAIRYNATSVYEWLAVSGSASWADPNSWNPTRFSPQPTDILLFNQGGTSTVTNIPTEVVAQILFSNNTTATFVPTTTNILSINGPTLTNNIVIATGSELTLSNGLTLTYASTSNQRGDISGVLNLNTGSALNTTAASFTIFTINATGVINNFGTTFTTSPSTFVFSASSNYNHNSSGGAVPTSTWNSASNTNINSASSATLGGMTQTFGNFILNTGGAVTTTLGSSVTNVVSNFVIQSGTLADNGYSVNVAGNFINNGVHSGTGRIILTGGPAAHNISGTGTYRNLELNDVLGSNLFNSIAIDGTLTLTNGSFSIGTNTLTLNGAINYTAGNFTGSNASNLVLSSNGVATSLPLVNAGLNNLSLTRTTPATTTFTNDISLSGNLTIASLNTLADGGKTITVNGNVAHQGIYSGVGKILLAGGASAHQLSGSSTYLNLEMDDVQGATMFNSFTIQGNFNLVNGAFSISNNTLTLSGTTNGAGFLAGTNNSSLVIAGVSGGNIGTIRFAPASQNLGNFTMSRIGANGAVTLGSALTVFNNFNWPAANNGLIYLDNYNFNIDVLATANFNFASVGAMFVASGSGKLVRGIPGGISTSTNFLFPVGENTGTLQYSPITLNFVATSAIPTSRNIGAGVIDLRHPNDVLSNFHFVSRYWPMSCDDISGTYSFYPTIRYITGAGTDVNGTESMILINRFDPVSSTWAEFPSQLSSPEITTIDQVSNPDLLLTDFDITGRNNSCTITPANMVNLQTFPTAALPANWTNTTVQGAQAWTIRNTPTFSSPSAGYYAVFDDELLGPAVAPNEAILAMPITNYLDRYNLKLSYYTYWFGRENTNGFVEISNNSGVTWTTIRNYQDTTFGSLAVPYYEVLDISSIADNQCDVRIRFRYNDGNQVGKFWYLDDINVFSENNAGITKLVAPAIQNCSTTYGVVENVTVRIFNFGYQNITNVPVKCQITGGITQTLTGVFAGTIPPQSFVDYTFASTVNLSAVSAYHFKSFTELPGESYYLNDTLLDGRQQRVTVFSSSTNFNSSNSGWTTGRSNPSNDTRDFVYGSVPYLGGAQGNGKSFYLNMTGPSGYNGDVWVESPVYDFSNNTRPILSMDIKYELYTGNNPVILQYSINDGVTWTSLGTSSDPNWYNQSNYWGNNNGSPISSWTAVKHELCNLSGEACVRFRISTSSYYYSANASRFAFDNFAINEGTNDDLEVVEFVNPQAGKCAGFTASEQVSIVLQNNTCRPLTNIPVSFNMTGAGTATFNEVIPGPVPRFGRYKYTFTNTVNMSTAGNYILTATTGTTPTVRDTFLTNNTKSINLTSTPLITYPYLANFNTGNQGWSSGTTSANGNRVFRRGTFSYLNGNEFNSDSWFIDMAGPSGYSGDVWVESPVFNLTGLSSPLLQMDIKYQLYTANNPIIVQYSLNGGTSWITLGTSADPNWYNQTNYWGNNDASPVNIWTTMQRSLCSIVGQACVKFRVTTSSFYYSANNSKFAFDNFAIIDQADVSVAAIVAPFSNGCLYSATQVATISVYNASCGPISNVPVEFEVKRDNVVIATLTGIVPGPIPVAGAVNYTFSGTFDMIPLGLYTIKGYSEYPGDLNQTNDTAYTTINIIQPKISTFPYLQDFNLNAGNWLPGKSNLANNNRNFVYGAVPYLGGAQGNGNSFYLNMTDASGYNGDVWVESPVFDFSNNTRPVLSMNIKYELYTGNNPVLVQYSINGGGSWATLGTSSDPIWYNQTNYWGNNNGSPLNNWIFVGKELCNLSGEPCVKFRITTSSYYYSANASRFAFDNFAISEGTNDDLEAIEIVNPQAGKCTGFTSTEPISIVIQNNTCRPLTNIPIELVMTGAGAATINEVMPGPVPRFGRYKYTFTSTVNMSAVGTYTLTATTGTTPTVRDTFPGNNSKSAIFTNVPINTYPYIADFNAGNQGWASGTSSTGPRVFRRGTFNYLNGNEANGDSWYIDMAGPNGYSGDVWVESPVFNLTGLTSPILQMDIKYQLYTGNNPLIVQYSLNGGTSWTLLGTSADPDWYNQTNYWGNNDASPVLAWTPVQRSLCSLVGQTCIKFRVITNSYYYSANSSKFAFDNFVIREGIDVGATAIIAPVSSGCLYSNTQQATISVYNTGCAAVSNIPVEFKVKRDGVDIATLVGIVPGPLAAASSVNYTFPTTFDMLPVGVYTFKAYTAYLADINNTNDTVIGSLTVLQPRIVSYPYLQDFNIDNGYWLAGKSNLANNNRNFTYGVVPYLGGAQGNGNSFYLNMTDASGYNGDVWVESPVFNLTGLTSPILKMDVKYELYTGNNAVIVQYSTNGGTSWTTLGTSTDPNWYNQTNYFGNNLGSPINNWVKVQRNLCSLAGLACVKFRISTSSFYYSSNASRFAFDNFEILETIDLAVTTNAAPATNGCLYSNTQQATIAIYNSGCISVTNVPVSYQIKRDGILITTLLGTVPGPITAGNAVSYTFPTTFDMLPTGQYTFKGYSTFVGDANTSNDTVYKTINVLQPRITSYPYVQDFNIDNGYWLAGKSNIANNNRNFTYGAVPYLNGVQGNGNGFYLNMTDASGYNGDVWVESPVFDFTSLTNPKLNMLVKYELYTANNPVLMQYSTNGGSSWLTLGTSAEPNWYNQTNYWGNNSGAPVNTWRNMERNLCALAGLPCVKFRVATSSYYYSANASRFVFDSFRITNAPLDIEVVSVNGCFGSAYGIDVTVKNNSIHCSGSPTITSLDLTYSVNGNAPVTTNFNTGISIAPGATQIITIPSVLVPTNISTVAVWSSSPNGGIDNLTSNDTYNANPAIWPNCNDHCSNAIELVNQITLATQNNYSTTTPGEDPNFGNCIGATVENTVWYYFETDCDQIGTTVTFKNIVCSPSSSGIQVTIDRLIDGQAACIPANYVNVFCSFQNNTSNIVWTGSALPNSTYYITTDGVAGNQCTFEIELDKTIDTLLPAVSINVEDNFSCEGIQKVLTPIGGTSGIAGEWNWYSDSTLTTHIFEGDSLIVNPPAGVTRYWLRAESECDSTTAIFVDVETYAPATISSYFINGNPAAGSFTSDYCFGDGTSFSVNAIGTGLTYQWEFSSNSGSTWSSAGLNLYPYTGWQSDSLNIDSVFASYNGYQYRVIVSSNLCVSSDTSTAGQVNVSTLPIINVQPVNEVACLGSSTVLNADVEATGIIDFNWEFYDGTNWVQVANGAPIGSSYTGINSDSLTVTTIAGTTPPGIYAYRLKYNTFCNAITPYVSDSVSFTIQQSGGWLGTVSEDWNDSGNWCGSVPTSSTDVVVPSTTVTGYFPKVFGLPIATCNHLTLNSGASITIEAAGDLTVNGNFVNDGNSIVETNGKINIIGNLSNNAIGIFEIELDGEMQINGDFTNDGNSIIGAGNVKLQGTNTQTFSGLSNIEIGKLITAGSANGIALSMESDIHVLSELNLQNNTGKIDLNNHILTLGEIGNNGVLTGGGASNYIISQTGASQFIRYATTAAPTTYLFPLGDATGYTPISVTMNNGASVGSNTRLQSSMTTNAHPNLGSSSNYISRYWTVEPLNLTGIPSYGVEYIYKDADVTGVEAQLKPYKYGTNSGWIAAIGSGASYEQGTGVVNPGTNTITWTGLSSFSDFTGNGNGTPLPISLLEFNAVPLVEAVELTWVTATETNNDYFTLERAKDGINFEVIHIEDGAGNSNQILNYSWVDNNPFDGYNYYRLKQTDFDGNFTYSIVRVVNFSKPVSTNSNWVNVYPNPITNGLVFLNFGEINSDEVNVLLYNSTGQIVWESKVSAESNKTSELKIYGLSNGLYYLQIQNENLIEKMKILIK
jgi:hypothetical protein